MRRAAFVLLAAVLLDATTFEGVGTLAGTLLVVASALGIVATRQTRSRDSVLLCALAVVLGSFLVVRAAPWLNAIDATAAGLLLVLAAMLTNRGGVLDLSPAVLQQLAERVSRTLGRRALDAAGAGRAGIADVIPAEGASIARGVAVAVPTTIALVALLASADAVFAHLLQVKAPSGAVAHHALALALGAGAMLALASTADVAALSVEPVRSAHARRTEAFIVLGAVNVVLAIFATTQLVTALGGADAVVRSEGLTYAEYARGGFFQLVGAAALMLVVVGLARALSLPSRGLTLLSLTAIGLTLVIVGVAAERMRLYEDAYGLTVLRLAVLWSILWIAIGLVLVGIAIAGVRSRRHWLSGSLVLAAAAVLIALNISNPEAVIARTNLDRARHGAQIDRSYLAGLSADAAGVLARDPLGRDLVHHHRHRSTILGWNLARSRG
jgi:two-component system sensor histidine kinase BaeS